MILFRNLWSTQANVCKNSHEELSQELPGVQDSFRVEATKPIHWLAVNMLESVLQIVLGKKHFHLFEGKRAQEHCMVSW